MNPRSAHEVAARCLCLELLLQRLGLETDDSDAVNVRDDVRVKWLGRLEDLGVDEAILPAERALLEAKVGTLDEDALDDLLGRASGALVLLWALGRLETRPRADAVDTLEELISEHGLLGDGAVAAAREALGSAALRDERELHEGVLAYGRARGKSKVANDAEKVFADVALHHLDWALDDDVAYDEDEAE